MREWKRGLNLNRMHIHEKPVLKLNSSHKLSKKQLINTLKYIKFLISFNIKKQKFDGKLLLLLLIVINGFIELRDKKEENLSLNVKESKSQ